MNWLALAGVACWIILMVIIIWRIERLRIQQQKHLKIISSLLDTSLLHAQALAEILEETENG